ncbi:MAG TPA: ornithine carbamoyltransferase [Terriglobales bacterium]|nr:ornithine carbamoyltransferase [Terriglobales bacterium]
MSTARATTHLSSLSTPDLLSMQDLSPAEVGSILNLAALVKARPAKFRHALEGKQMVLMFEKPSLRTRLTFEAGMGSLGGRSMFVDQTNSRIGARESLADVAHNLERWVDVIVLRTFEHKTVVDMAGYAAIPVINGLSELEHPCQALADYLTLQEKFQDLRRLRMAYVGDGNNVAHSLLLAAACLGSSLTVAVPKGYEPSAAILRAAREIAAETGAKIDLTHDPKAAVRGADAVYTDVWASMGQEAEQEKRAAIFAPFQVNARLMALAASHAVFLHCLPAHRGLEVTDEVMDSPRSVVFDQAENRLHVQKAILLLLLGGNENSKGSAHA